MIHKALQIEDGNNLYEVIEKCNIKIENIEGQGGMVSIADLMRSNDV